MTQQDRTHDDDAPHVPDDLREEIVTVLSENAPTDEDRAEWAREALDRAGDLPASPRPPIRRIALGLAAAAAILVVAVLLGGRGEPMSPEKEGEEEEEAGPEIHVASESEIEKARAENENGLAGAKVREWLAGLPAGTWVGIAAGGGVRVSSAKLPSMLENLDGLTTGSPHRFVFRLGDEGDVTYPTTFDYEVVIGTKFLAEFDLSFSRGPDGWAFRGPDGNATRMTPSPDGRPFLSATVLLPGCEPPKLVWDGPHLVATGYAGPLILPEGRALPRYEIPGSATVGTTRKYRRFVADVRLGALGGRFVEVLGDRLTPISPLKLGGVEWHRHGPGTWEEAHRSGKPLLILVHDVSGFLPSNVFGGLEDRLAQFVTATHVTRWIEPWGLTEKPFTAPAEMAAYRIEKASPREAGAARLLGRYPLGGDVKAGDVDRFLRLVSNAPSPTLEEDRDRARRINDAALRSPEVRLVLGAAPEDSWAAIAGGRLLKIDQDRDAVLAEVSRSAEREHHVYLFRVGTEGNVTYETTWPYEQVVGNRFLGEADLTFSHGPDGSRFWRRTRPPGEPLPRQRPPCPSPDGRPYIPLRIALSPTGHTRAKTPVTFLVATGFGGPMILPDWYPMGGPEIPGLATVKDMHGNERVFRRFMQRVLLDDGIEFLVEALGARQTPAPAVRLGGADWSRYGPDVPRRCLREDKLLLLLVADVTRPPPPEPFGEGESKTILDGFVRAVHMTPWTSPSGLWPNPDGFRPPELLIYAPVPGQTDFISVGRWRIEDQRPESVRDFLKPFVNGGAYRKKLDRVRRERGMTEAVVRLTFRVDVAESAVPYPPPAAVIAALTKRLVGTGARIEEPAGDSRRLTVILPPSSMVPIETIRALCERPGGSLAFRIVAKPDDPTVDGPLSKHLAGDPETLPASPDPEYPGYRSYPNAEGGGSTVVRLDRWNFTERDLENVEVIPDDRTGIGYVIRFQIRDDREGDFAKLTGPNSAVQLGGHGHGRLLAIVLDGRIVSAPVLNDELRDGGLISGGGDGFERPEAEALAATLRSGPLPAALKLVRIERLRDGRVVETEKIR